MAKPARVDILIPAYNAAATLRATLNSVRLQTLPLESVTVVDDGSTDATADIAGSFKGVRYVRNERNLGCSGNWNRCLDLATGDLVCLLHSDDLLVPGWHARLQDDVRLAEKPLETAYYLGAVRFADRGGIVESYRFDDRARLHAPGELLKRLWRHHFYGLTTSACMVYGRELLARLGRFPGAEFPNMPDVPFHWALLLDYPIVYDPELLVLIRRGAPNQVGKSRRTELALGALKAYEAVAGRLAAVLGRDPARVTAEYLFPYGVMDLLGTGRGKSEVPAAVLEAFRAAEARCGKAYLLAVALGELAERMRRGCERSRRAKQVAALLAQIEDGGERLEGSREPSRN
jgi:glycosyltransferase involved in cell wall biosynthesis